MSVCVCVCLCLCVGIEHLEVCTESSRFLVTPTLVSCKVKSLDRSDFYFTSPSFLLLASKFSSSPPLSHLSFPACFPVFVRNVKRKCSKHNKAVYVSFWTAQCADYNKLKVFPLLRVLALPYGSTRNINLTGIMNYTGVPKLRTRNSGERGQGISLFSGEERALRVHLEPSSSPCMYVS